MSLRLPSITTPHLLLRELAESDLDDLHRILDLELGSGEGIESRRAWLSWSLASYQQHAALHQPPYGDRAAVLRETGKLIGVVGYSPMFHPLADMLDGAPAPSARWLPEMGLYYAFSPAQRGRGYATEAARALIEYAFEHFRLKRIVANTEHDNLASQRVMEKLGMTLFRNDAGEPSWFEVLGVLDANDHVGSG